MSDLPTAPDPTLLARFLAGECTPEEAAAVQRYLRDSPARAQELEQLTAAWAQIGNVVTVGVEPDIDAFWRRVRAGIEAPAARPVQLVRPRRRWPFPLKVAAVVMIVAGAGIAGRAVLVPRHAPAIAAGSAFNVISTTRGQRLSVRLTDGTAVTLAPSTTLRMPSTYGRRDRTVELEGQATFTVTHDSTRPFSVQTARAVALDLGTEFVVRAYADEARTDIVVAEGKVVVSRRDPRPLEKSGGVAPDSIVITRGERVQVDAAGRLLASRDIPLDPYFAWTAGRLVFRGAPLQDVATQLGRWYDVDIRVESTHLGATPLDASFRDESVDEALRIIGAVLKLEVSRAGRTYTLRGQ